MKEHVHLRAGFARKSERSVTPAGVKAIRDALQYSQYSYVAGSTHAFYHYPARFSAAILRASLRSRTCARMMRPLMSASQE